MDLSDDQASAFEQILLWFRAEEDRPQRLTFGGYAGTGKTTLIRKLVLEVGVDDVAVCAPTGKAASVLRRKGLSRASTVHGLIYSPVEICVACDREVAEGSACGKCNSTAHVRTSFARVPLIEAELVIVDEASMLDVAMIQDLESFGVPVLYVGDHGQLEPVGEDPGLMRDPTIRLENIHRQAEGSPIITFAHLLRQGVSPAAWTGSGEVNVRFGFGTQNVLDYDVILCGTNQTRVAVNAKVRERLGHGERPVVGERLICLQNNRDMGLFNGMLANVIGLRNETPDVWVLDLEDDLGTKFLQVPALKSQFHSPDRPARYTRSVAYFDYGYAMTCHKAQGSEFPRVAVLEQLCRFTPSRWRYTAATRACQQLDYFLPNIRR